MILLALHFGKQVIQIAQSAPFRWGMVALISICVAGSGYSVWKWLHRDSPVERSDVLA